MTESLRHEAHGVPVTNVWSRWLWAPWMSWHFPSASYWPKFLDSMSLLLIKESMG